MLLLPWALPHSTEPALRDPFYPTVGSEGRVNVTTRSLSFVLTPGLSGRGQAPRSRAPHRLCTAGMKLRITAGGPLKKKKISWSKAETSLLFSNMAHDSHGPNKTMAMNRGQGHTTFTEDQFNVLIKTFSLKSNLGYATEQTNSEDSRSQIRFQNRRARPRV